MLIKFIKYDDFHFINYLMLTIICIHYKEQCICELSSHMHCNIALLILYVLFKFKITKIIMYINFVKTYME